MLPISPVDTIAHNIQLAIAPVFLLTAVGSILGVLAHRLGRVIDRARLLEAEIGGYDAAMRSRAATELKVLDRRISAVNWAIALCTGSALFVCVVIAILFIGDLVAIDAGVAVALLFIAAMILLIAGLLLFLLEVRIATRVVRVRAEMLDT